MKYTDLAKKLQNKLSSYQPDDEQELQASIMKAKPVAIPSGDGEASDGQRALYYALTAGLPTLIGAAFGGSQGGAIGAQAGEKAIQAGFASESEAKKRKEAEALKQSELQMKYTDKIEERRQKEEQQKENLAVRREGLQAQAENRAIMTEMARGREADRAENIQQRRIDNLAKNVTPFQETFSSIANLEEEMGFKLDDFDQKTGLVNGEKVDLPGVSIPGYGRATLAQRSAQNIETIASEIFNKKLSERSGTAVTANELARLEKEFARGRFNSEEQLLGALKRYRQLAMQSLQAQEARDPKAALEYQSREGGFGSNRIKTNPVLMPGQSAFAAEKSAYEMNEAELDEYLRSRGVK